MDPVIADVGDWIRFEKGGTVVLGIILYIDKSRKKYPYEIEAITDCGRVSLYDILEFRKPIESK